MKNVVKASTIALALAWSAHAGAMQTVDRASNTSISLPSNLAMAAPASTEAFAAAAAAGTSLDAPAASREARSESYALLLAALLIVVHVSLRMMRRDRD